MARAADAAAEARASAATDNAGMHMLLLDGSALPAGWYARELQAGRLPRLRRLLRLGEVIARGPAVADVEAAWLSPAELWLQRALELAAAPDGAAQQLPWGALAAVGGGLQACGPHWALALPVHLALGHDSVQLADPATLDIDEAQSRDLLDAVLPLLQEEGWQVQLLSPGCWLLAHVALRGVRTADPWRAIGRNAAGWMPGGAQAAHWRRLLTEVQMVWLDHPVNLARAARGQPQINSLWLHGCGALAQPPRSPFVLAEAQAAQPPAGSCAWRIALQAALPALPRTAEADVLEVLQPAPTAEDDAAAIDGAIEAVLLPALRRDGAARLVLAGSRSWVDLRLRRAGGWRIWSRGPAPEALAQV